MKYDYKSANKKGKKNNKKPNTKANSFEFEETQAPRPKKKEFRRREESFVNENFEIDENIRFGRNSVMEALKGNREIDKIMVQKGEKEGSVIKIISLAKSKNVVVQEVEKAKLDELTGREKHQGVLAYVAAQEYSSVEEILEEAREKGEQPFVVILDNIQDPHNLGAIIRTAHNAGAHGVIIPKQNVHNLNLSTEVVEAVKSGQFHIYAISTIEEGIEILTGVPAGKKDENGKFPAGTINFLAYERLKKYADASKYMR